MRKYAFIGFMALLFLVSCRFMGRQVRGNGVVKTEEKTVSTFNEVQANGEIRLLVPQGELKPVRIECDENLLQYIEVHQEGSRLVIETRQGVNIHPSGDLNVYVTSPNYKSIEVSGSSDIIGQNKITSTEKVELGASGAGNIEMDIDAPAVDAGISGSGSIKLRGQTRDLDIDLSGAGHAYCFDLQSENTKVGISGAGSAQVHACVSLRAEVSGAGNVTYKGKPTVSQEISGAGNVSSAN